MPRTNMRNRFRAWGSLSCSLRAKRPLASIIQPWVTVRAAIQPMTGIQAGRSIQIEWGQFWCWTGQVNGLDRPALGAAAIGGAAATAAAPAGADSLTIGSA